jgi:pyruvate dehydrogenase E1 component
LQHQDGHSQLVATTVPNVVAYDAAFAYELAVIVGDGLRRMFRDQETLIYYLTLYNEAYAMPAMPAGAEEGILRGAYRLRHVDGGRGHVQLFGSGPIVREVLAAQQLLAERHGIGSDAWSVTSYRELRRDALAAERWNRLHPEQPPRASYLERVTAGVEGPFVAASDYVKLVADQIARWLPGPLTTLGTDGFGRSDTRAALRRHFEVDAANIAVAALAALARARTIDRSEVARAVRDLELDPDRIDPVEA